MCAGSSLVTAVVLSRRSAPERVRSAAPTAPAAESGSMLCSRGRRPPCLLLLLRPIGTSGLRDGTRQTRLMSKCHVVPEPCEIPITAARRRPLAPSLVVRSGDHPVPASAADSGSSNSKSSSCDVYSLMFPRPRTNGGRERQVLGRSRNDRHVRHGDFARAGSPVALCRTT